MSTDRVALVFTLCGSLVLAYFGHSNSVQFLAVARNPYLTSPPPPPRGDVDDKYFLEVMQARVASLHDSALSDLVNLEGIEEALQESDKTDLKKLQEDDKKARGDVAELREEIRKYRDERRANAGGRASSSRTGGAKPPWRAAACPKSLPSFALSFSPAEFDKRLSWPLAAILAGGCSEVQVSRMGHPFLGGVDQGPPRRSVARVCRAHRLRLSDPGRRLIAAGRHGGE